MDNIKNKIGNLDWGVILLTIFAVVSLGLFYHTYHQQQITKQHLKQQAQSIQQTTQSYEQAKKAPLNELPKYDTLRSGLNQFLDTSVKAINQKNEAKTQLYLKYGTPSAFEALSVLFTSGEAGEATVKIVKVDMTYNEQMNQTNCALGQVTTEMSYGKRVMRQTYDVYADLTPKGYVNRLEFGHFKSTKGD